MESSNLIAPIFICLFFGRCFGIAADEQSILNTREVNSMNASEVEKILATSTKDEWIVDDESGSFTYKNDLNLRIERADYETYEDFDEPWAKAHADNRAFAIYFTVKYGSSFVDKRRLVSVDGHRATLPMPKSLDDLRVTDSQVNFARIVDLGDRVDEYLDRSKIEVVAD